MSEIYSKFKGLAGLWACDKCNSMIEGSTDFSDNEDGNEPEPIKCGHPGCKTNLSRYNPYGMCYVHAGGAFMHRKCAQCEARLERGNPGPFCFAHSKCRECNEPIYGGEYCKDHSPEVPGVRLTGVRTQRNPAVIAKLRELIEKNRQWGEWRLGQLGRVERRISGVMAAMRSEVNPLERLALAGELKKLQERRVEESDEVRRMESFVQLCKSAMERVAEGGMMEMDKFMESITLQGEKR